MRHWRVTPDREGQRLGAFLAKEYLNTYSARQIKQAIEKNGCYVNGKIERHASTILLTNDHIQFDEAQLASNGKENRCFETSRVLYEDDSILVYHKPSGLTSDTELYPLLKRYFETIYMVHRLDRDTSGVILFAKSKIVLDRLIALFDEKMVKKEYLAVVAGSPEKKSGCIENFLGKVYQRGEYVLWGALSPLKGGVKAVTDWEVVYSLEGYSLIRCYPYTGRTHQIRVHLDQLGCPILGDTRYGKKKHTFANITIPRCLLHARSIQFPHHVSGKVVKFTAPIPEDMEKSMMELNLCLL